MIEQTMREYGGRFLFELIQNGYDVQPPGAEDGRIAIVLAGDEGLHGTLSGSFAAFIGHPAYNTGTLCADLHRFAFLLEASDGEELFGELTPLPPRPAQRTTRLTRSPV